MPFDPHLISLIIVTPLIGALAVLATRTVSGARRTALVFTLIAFALSLRLPFGFDRSAAGMQFVQRLSWIPSFHIHYYVGVDGLSLWLVPLTALLSVIGVLVSWQSVSERARTFYLLLLLLDAGMIGVFVSLDMFLFYVFWEASLVPMALLIGIFGHDRRIYAAVKFFLYTMAGSVLMLGGILWLYNLTGTFDWVKIQQAAASGALHFSPATAIWLFLAFFIAFAIKVPLFPFHTWLPYAHGEAPTAGSVLLAGVLLKMGPYGMLRFCLPLFPTAARALATPILVLGLIGIIYGGLVAFVQPNMKKLVAYSSVSHMGFIIVGVFTFTAIGLQGSVYQMLNHGVSTAGLFILVGMLYERRHTFELKEFGGIATVMPVYAGFFVLLVMSSAGLPLLNGFVGEFLISLGAFLARHAIGIVAISGVIVSAIYLLHWTKSTIWGDVKNPKNQGLKDINGRERLVLATMGVLALAMGLVSPVFLNKIAPSAEAEMRPFQTPAAFHPAPAGSTPRPGMALKAARPATPWVKPGAHKTAAIPAALHAGSPLRTLATRGRSGGGR